MPDIARDPAILKRKKLRHALYAAVGVLIVVAVSIALARMEPAAPTVDINADSGGIQARRIVDRLYAEEQAGKVAAATAAE